MENRAALERYSLQPIALRAKAGHEFNLWRVKCNDLVRRLAVSDRAFNKCLLDLRIDLDIDRPLHGKVFR